MSNHKAEKFYNSLVQLQSELETTVVKKCQQLIEEILKSEKQVLLQNIHKLVEDEFADLLDGDNLNSQSQKFRCDSCNKHFSSTNIGQITITPTDNGMTYENSEYYNESECQNPFLESENYDEQDQSSSEMPDIKPIVEILQYDPLNSNNVGESSSSLSITSNGVNDDDMPISNYPRNKDGNFEIINTMTTVETPTSSSALQNRKFIPHSQFYPAKNKMRPFKSYIDKRKCIIEQSPLNNSDRDGKRHKCSSCNYATNVATNLKKHLELHNSQKRFKCSKCSYSSCQRHHLTHHILSAHNLSSHDATLNF